MLHLSVKNPFLFGGRSPSMKFEASRGDKPFAVRGLYRNKEYEIICNGVVALVFSVLVHRHVRRQACLQVHRRRYGSTRAIHTRTGFAILAGWGSFGAVASASVYLTPLKSADMSHHQ